MFENGPVCWCCKKPNVASQITAEAEYIALSFAVGDALWIKRINWMDKTMSKIFNIQIEGDN